MSASAEPAPSVYIYADEPVRTHRHGWWWSVLIAGAVLWVLTIGTTVATQNANLVPTLILLGSFLVPFSVVLFAAERISTTFPTSSLMIAFFVGGVLGVLGASVLEAPLNAGGLGGFLLVGLIEELVKAVRARRHGRGISCRRPLGRARCSVRPSAPDSPPSSPRATPSTPDSAQEASTS